VKKVLIVSYYYPPLAGVGIVKVLGTTRYLPEFGWQPSVLCAKPDGYYITDPANVGLHTPQIFARHAPFAPFLMKAFAKLGVDARRGFILPDNQIDWFLPACRAGRRELRRQRYDMIYTTVPSYTSGLVAAHLSSWSGLPFVMNVRDPWIDRTMPGCEHRTRLHRHLDLALEDYVVRRSRKLTFIYQIGLDQYLSRYPQRARDMAIVRPGFDFERENGTAITSSPGKVTLAYAGILYPPYSAMRKLAQLLAGCRHNGLDLTLGLWGCDSIPMAHKIVVEEGLSDCVTWGKRVSLKEVFAIERGVTANVILLDFKTVPTKLYELLAAGRKILYVGPRVEDQEALLKRYSPHFLCIESGGSTPTKEDVQRLAHFLKAPEDAMATAHKRELVRQELSARAQTGRLAAILDEAAEVGPV
jgi:hypothetical protein